MEGGAGEGKGQTKTPRENSPEETAEAQNPREEEGTGSSPLCVVEIFAWLTSSLYLSVYQRDTGREEGKALENLRTSPGW